MSDANEKMKVIGLTGGIGSGKSTVSGFLAEMGAVILDADKIGHEVLKPSGPVWQQVVAAFGKEIIAADGNIDRKKLGEMVFGDAEAISRLNGIMHPVMYEVAKSRLEKYHQQGVKVVVLEAPLLIEAGWTSLVDEIWVTVASEVAILKRLKGRTGMSERESRARIRSQIATEERIRYADVIIDTDCKLDELKCTIRELWHKLQE